MCIVTMLTLLVSCSTKKNTPATRAYHALTAHYNTLYNGEVAYLEGTDAQYKGHKDNFNELLPMYICTNKTTAGMGKSNFETAITKCEKAIKVHSIKKRPVTVVTRLVSSLFCVYQHLHREQNKEQNRGIRVSSEYKKNQTDLSVIFLGDVKVKNLTLVSAVCDITEFITVY